LPAFAFRPGVTGRRAILIVAVATTIAATFVLAVEHGQRSIEVTQDDFGGVFVVAVLVLPFAGFERAFDVDLRALLEKLLDDAHEALVEHNDAVPFGLFLAFARSLVAPRL
jgi:capsid portal protein